MNMDSSRWRSPWLVPLGLIVLGSIAMIFFGDPFERLEMIWLDQLLRLRLSVGMTPRVDDRLVHLDLALKDEKATAAQEYKDAAKIIQEAAASGAEVVVFDVIFGRGDITAAEPLLDAMEKVRSEYRCIVILGESGEGGGVRSFPFVDARYQPAGMLDVPNDVDGVYRRYTFIDPAGEPSLALSAYLAFQGITWPGDLRSESKSVRWTEATGSERSVPREPTLLNFRSRWDHQGPETFRHYRRDELSNFPPDQKRLRGCILLVAHTQTGDTATTPLGVKQPGVLLHSTALNDLFQNTVLRRMPRYGEAILLSPMLLFGIVGHFRYRRLALVAIWLSACCLILLLSAVLVFKLGLVPGTVFAVVVCTVAFLGGLLGVTSPIAQPFVVDSRIGKCRILFLAASPKTMVPLDLDEESRAIEQKISAATYRDQLEFIQKWAVRPDDLLQHLNQYKPEVVHFSGHGSENDEIILLDREGQPKPVAKAAIKQLFTTLRDNVRIVVLNACFSREQANGVTEVIDCAIGMRRAIGDRAAITFAASFYGAVGFGRSVHEAFEQGKTALMLAGIPEEKTPELLLREGVDARQVFLVRGESQKVGS